MLKNDVRSRNVIENKGNRDILSCYLSDILGSSELVLTEYAPFGATKVTFSMLPNRQCTALAMPRREPPGQRLGVTSTGRRLVVQFDVEAAEPVPIFSGRRDVAR
jgi:hypothetical protein